MKHITREYALLFNTISDTLRVLETLQLQLALAQQRAEALFLEEDVAFPSDSGVSGMVS